MLINPGGAPAGFNMMSLSAREGVRTARDIEAQNVWECPGVHNTRALG